ncbi:Holliday junction resolvase RecU [Hutsoniella sourekii]
MLNYPSGQNPARLNKQLGKQAWTSRSKKSQTNYGSRGASFEARLNDSNEYYLKHKLAVIHKKPTPIQVVKVDYPKRSAAKITEAYYRHASTTDYNGVYQGKYIDFEAKETKNKTRFPLSNIKEHQLTHMLACQEQGGIAFFLISFRSHRRVYLLPLNAIIDFIHNEEQKSIPYSYICDHGFECPCPGLPAIDYLKALDQYMYRD